MSNFETWLCRGLLCWCACAAPPLHAAIPASVLQPPAAAALSAALATAAARRGLPVDAIALAREPGPARTGDEVTALVSLRDGSALRKWLVHFRVAPLTDNERSGYQAATFTLTAGSGRTYRFSSGTAVALDIVTLGPATADQTKPVAEKQGRAVVSAAELGIGLDRTAQALLRLAAQDAASRAAGSKTAGPQTLAEPDERAIFGAVPALMAFFQAVQRTPGLQEILWGTIEKPSLWTLLKNPGRLEAGFNMGAEGAAILDPAPWGLPAVPLYRLSMELVVYKKTALFCSFFVTAPVPPLLTTAGIAGIVAEPPGSKGKRLEIRVIGARRGPTE